jgi:hypothetical protein
MKEEDTMHCATMVVTGDRPIEAILTAALVPFYDIKFDWCALGGRYSGLLIAADGAETLTGGGQMTPAEVWHSEMAQEFGAEFHMPGTSGPGVDAVRKRDFRGCYKQDLPQALVLRGEWHEAPLFPFHMVVSMMQFVKSRGVVCRDPDEFMSTVNEEELRQERALRDEWKEKVLSLLDTVGDDEWLSLVDCHD